MPLYEYRCEECGHEFEELVSFSKADQPAKCPKCGAEKSKRLLSGFASPGSSSSGSAPSCGSSGSSGCGFT